MKRISEAIQLFQNNEIYSKTGDIPTILEKQIEAVLSEEFKDSEENEEFAYETIKNWVSSLWKAMNYFVDLQQLPEQDSVAFKKKYLQGLLEFIAHKDHGILHSYFVYSGILHLAKQDGKPIVSGSCQDQQAQLFALLHDIAQVLPFSAYNSGHISRMNQKNEHARILSALVKMFGIKAGFDKKATAEFSFAIKTHDSTYSNVRYPEIDYIFQLGHDSDKIFGSSMKKDIKTITKGMLKRNYEANRGPKGSYLLRTELTKTYRNNISYGDRCLSDAVSLVRREFGIEMYTQAGRRIAEERRNSAMEQIKEVYGYFFDLTKAYIEDKVLPILGKQKSNLIVTETGMDQVEKPLRYMPTTRLELQNLFDTLYETPIRLAIDPVDEKKYTDRYNLETDARGLKIHVVDTNTGKDVYLDPSIARFCFSQDGRERFLEEITTAFQNGIH